MFVHNKRHASKRKFHFFATSTELNSSVFLWIRRKIETYRWQSNCSRTDNRNATIRLLADRQETVNARVFDLIPRDVYRAKQANDRNGNAAAIGHRSHGLGLRTVCFHNDFTVGTRNAMARTLGYGKHRWFPGDGSTTFRTYETWTGHVNVL